MELVEREDSSRSRRRIWEGYVDWRRREAVRGRHGGMAAAGFVLGVEILENLAFLANASNLVMYLTKSMQYSPGKSANEVTNFMGTAFLLALLGGFLSDAFFTTYYVFIFSSFLEFLGLVILTVQAKVPSLKPTPCDEAEMVKGGCREASGSSAAVLYIGLYLVALGVGGIKGSLPAHGAEQFDEGSIEGRRRRSSFFNYFVFSLSCGGLVAVTLVVWIEDNLGWQWGFGISTLSILLSIPLFLSGSAFYRNKIPTGSPLTTILKVLVAAILNRGRSGKASTNAVASMAITSPSSATTPKLNNNNNNNEPSQSLKFLNKAAVQNPTLISCTTQEVEDVKMVLKVLPIFGCTIILNACLAQLSTFSVEQASTMNTNISSFKVPPASLPIFPVLFIIILAPLYDRFIIPFARTLTRSESGISHLQRIGVGLLLSVVAMGVAALVEIKRKAIADAHTSTHVGPLPISFLWIAFQYLFLGSADLFTLAGLLEFFFTEAPAGMRSLATSLSWASLAVGYYLSSVIVLVVNRVSGHHNRPWLSGQDINNYRLDKFYWLMCALSALNFLHYLFWSINYKYRSTPANN